MELLFKRCFIIDELLKTVDVKGKNIAHRAIFAFYEKEMKLPGAESLNAFINNYYNQQVTCHFSHLMTRGSAPESPSATVWHPTRR